MHLVLLVWALLPADDLQLGETEKSILWGQDPPLSAESQPGPHLLGVSRAGEGEGALTWMGLVPAATIFMPSAMMAALRMVAVVVPSPAVSLVLEAACAHAKVFRQNF